jgi:preprotein translocase subunit SecA
MLLGLALKKLLGTKNDRELKRIVPIVQAIGALEPKIRKLRDSELQAKTGELKGKLAQGAKLDDILIEAFAVAREAGARALGMRHFDVQLIGGIVLHEGKISEMKTGEGKTLVSTLPAYLNGLAGKGMHIITVNDYLAKRDSDWMGRLHRFMGVSVGCIVNSMSDSERKAQYQCDITYGTNNEFGFDYLRDNMKPSLDMYVQRDPTFAIIDEVDSILIDEARTPLIISGPSEDKPDLYYTADRVVRHIKKDIDYSMDEKNRSVSLTEEGVRKLEGLLSIDNMFAPDNIDLVHHVNAALKAHAVFKKDTDYVSRDGKIIIVDEFTGRLMPGRRWSDGLHQAIEAKEGVKIEPENQTLATITLQNYFRMYPKLGGMTGTADTEAAEFKKIYNLDVVVIPPNKPMVRKDEQDLVFRNEAGKYRAVIQDIKEKHEQGRPVLVGTVSVAKSERVAKLLTRLGIPHNVLNAKNHEREAEIIANAGVGAGVTIATNMAGRGTDILLAPGIANKGGLHVIGTERHESRRIDNQLRGRAGRQGDSGSSQFYLSLEDDLMRIFANDSVIRIMDKLGMEEDVPIQDRLVTRSIATAQKKVEMHHFDQREHVLKYDDVLNKQREVIYSMRRLVLEGKELKALVQDLSYDFTADLAQQFCPDKQPPSTWDWQALFEAARSSLGLTIAESDRKALEDECNSTKSSKPVADFLNKKATELYAGKETQLGEEMMRDIEKYFLIQSIDHHWREHLLALDHLREGIHLRGYAQKDPLIEYRKEAFGLFKILDRIIKQSALTRIFTVRPVSRQEQEQQRNQLAQEERARERSMQMRGPSLDAEGGEGGGVDEPADLQAGGGASARPKTEQNEAQSRGVNAALNFMKNYQAERTKALQQAKATQGNAEGNGSEADDSPTKPVTRSGEKIGRNDPCFCGSGKKYKHCHGK